MRTFFLLLLLSSSLVAKPIVLVSVQPQKFLVESIAGDACQVEVLVPPGASPHSYEPRARQIDLIKQAFVWFRIGESFEECLLPLVKEVIDQRENLDLIGCSCHDGADPHIWLSPSMLKQEARQICTVLEKLLNADFQENLADLIRRIDALEIKFRGSQFSKTILVSHPAFGYFCRDFGIEQLSVEMDGQEPSPKQLTLLMSEVEQKGLKRIFLQQQYSEKGSRRIAAELGLELFSIDPYAEDVLANLSHIGELFCD